MLHNEAGIPCVLIVKLLYKGKLLDFVVPMKSNITLDTDSSLYFALPPNKKTKDGYHHGILYIKLFPANRKYILPYLIKGDTFLEKVQVIINSNEQKIIDACQEYLELYENSQGNKYTSNIDLILDNMKD